MSLKELIAFNKQQALQAGGPAAAAAAAAAEEATAMEADEGAEQVSCEAAHCRGFVLQFVPCYC
jgi:ribosomal protein L12E/L44/L45/RPP1/RPP2